MDYLISTYLVPLAVRAVAALIFLGIGWLLYRWGVNYLLRMLKRTTLDELAIRFVLVMARAGIILLILIFVLAALGVDTTALVAVFGAVSIALGLALQDTIKHFASGIVLVLFHPFRSGDYVQASGIEGIVEHITLYSTTLRTGDNKEVIVPNAAVAGNTIINFAARPLRRLDMVISIRYSDDIQRARELILQALAADARILAEPAPQVAMDEIGASGLNFIVRPWIKQEDYSDVKWEFLERIKKLFDENHITIPFPQMDVHLDRPVSLQA